MEKNTHLQIPEESIRNEKITPTAGGKSYNRENYSEHGKKIYNQAIKIKKTQKQKKDIGIIEQFILEIESPHEIGGIKNSKNKIEKLGFDFISYSKNNKNIATARIDKKKYNQFVNKIDSYIKDDNHPNKTYLSVIEELYEKPIEDKIDNEINLESNEKINTIISLYNVLSSKEKKAILENIKDELKRINIESIVHSFINGITTIVCEITPFEIKNIFKEYSTIREIRKNHTAIIEQAMPIQELPNPLIIKEPESESLIGIIDSGIEKESDIFSSIIHECYPRLPDGTHKSPNGHGSFVASRCVFGDLIDECITSHELKPYCKIVDIPVFGITIGGDHVAPNEHDLMLILEDIIPKLHNRVKVYNLSLGFNSLIVDNVFSPLSKFIDFLSKKYDIIFFISSGNIRRLLGDFPQEHFSSTEARICPPGESLLAITVGSLAKYENESSLSMRNQLSPFSRIGPGADNGIKPELIVHGGNLTNSYTTLPRISTYGIDNDTKKLSVDNGTSFVTPIISQFAQRLFDMYPKSNANLIKALLFHFTKQPKLFENITINSNNLFGFGEPDIDAALYASEDNCTFIYEGTLTENNYQFVKFHIPKMLAYDNPDSKLKIKITLVYDPPVNPDNDLEYSCARISANLLKSNDDEIKKVNFSSEDKILNPWNPIIKMEKKFSRNYSVGEWFLKLRLYTRKIIEENYKQNYAVVIQVIDENSSGNVYDAVLKEYGEIYHQIILKIAA